MTFHNILKLESEILANDVTVHRVLGLNIFIANKNWKTHADPMKIFIEALCLGYESVYIAGSTAMEYCLHDLALHAPNISLDELFQPDIVYHSVPVGYYGGSFFGGDINPGASILFTAKNVFSKIADQVLYYDALAVLLYPYGTEGLRISVEIFDEYSDENKLIDDILKSAKYILVTKSDSQWIEIYTRQNNNIAEEEIAIATAKVASYISCTEWYQRNKDRLAWDELNLCMALTGTSKNSF